MKIIKKAYQVWHEGMLDENPNEGYNIDNLPVVYADTPGEAKAKAPQVNDFYLDNFSHEYHKFTDLKVRRTKKSDWIMHNGEKIRRGDLEYRIKEENRIAERRKKIESYPDHTCFYIQKGYVGNAVLWWGLNSSGYVCDIRKAQLYTKKEVLKDFVNGRIEDRIWESTHVLNCIKEIVDGQFLNSNYES